MSEKERKRLIKMARKLYASTASLPGLQKLMHELDRLTYESHRSSNSRGQMWFPE